MTQGDQAPTILVRPSTEADVPLMLAIYRNHVGHGVGDTGTYEPAPFDAEDLKQRRNTMRKHRLPHLVAEIEGQPEPGVAGCAYVVPFRKRPAYRYSVKHSIYVHPERLGIGVGRALLPVLIERCAEAGYRQLIGYLDAANTVSLKLHEACGFAVVGRLPAVPSSSTVGPIRSWCSAHSGRAAKRCPIRGIGAGRSLRRSGLSRAPFTFQRWIAFATTQCASLRRVRLFYVRPQS